MKWFPFFFAMVQLINTNHAASAEISNPFEYTCKVWIDERATDRSLTVSIHRVNKRNLASMNGIEAERLEHPNRQKTRWGYYQFENSSLQLGELAMTGFEVQPDLMAGLDVGWIYPLYREPMPEKSAFLCYRKQ